jgi:hypothetical protein
VGATQSFIKRLLTVLGVQFEKEHEKTPYIQRIYNDGPNRLIVCFYTEVLQYLLQQSALDMDLSFKRIRGEMNEFVFAGWVKEGEISMWEKSTI